MCIYIHIYVALSLSLALAPSLARSLALYSLSPISHSYQSFLIARAFGLRSPPSGLRVTLLMFPHPIIIMGCPYPPHHELGADKFCVSCVHDPPPSVYMYVCMHVHTYVCMYVCVYAYIYIYIHVSMHSAGHGQTDSLPATSSDTKDKVAKLNL